jgi:hypothetical protein
MTTYIPPKKNTGLIFYTSLVSQSTGQFQANPTLAAGDVKVATDDGAPANIGTLPAVDADFTKRIKVTLSASEMNGDNITIIFSDGAGAEWDDVTVSIQTSVQQIDDLATQTSVNTIDDFIDTEVAAIKAVTDALPNAGALTTIQADLDNIQTRIPAALSGDGFMKADLKSIEDELTSGNNATLNLKQLTIINGTGIAIDINSTNSIGMRINGGGANPAAQVNGGSSAGAGMEFGGGVGGGTGILIYAVDGNTDAVVIQGAGTGKSISAANDIAVSDGNLTLTAIANKVLASVIETGYTLKQSLRLMLSALAGKLSGAATTTVVIRSATDAKNRITATVDADGNRTAVTHDTTD